MRRKKSSRQTLVVYRCHFRSEPEDDFTVTCPELPPIVTYGESLEETQANAGEAMELRSEVMREDVHVSRSLVSPSGARPIGNRAQQQCAFSEKDRPDHAAARRRLVDSLQEALLNGDVDLR